MIQEAFAEDRDEPNGAAVLLKLRLTYFTELLTQKEIAGSRSDSI
jgi:hypothetical protein